MKRAARILIVAASAVASLALTYGAWQAAHEQSEREDRLRFDLRVQVTRREDATMAPGTMVSTPAAASRPSS